MRALFSLAERELALVHAGAWEDLAALAADRDALLAAYVPTEADRPALERLAAQQALITAALGRARSETGAELARLGRGRGAVRGYAASGPAAAARAGALDDAA